MTERHPTLIERKSMGGLEATNGFQAQAAYLISVLPAALADVTFEGFIYEGFDDIELRYFSPGSEIGRVLDRAQVKSGHLSTGDIKAVVNAFVNGSKHNPAAYRRFILCVDTFPTDIRPLSKHLDRISRARPAYLPFPGLLDASEQALAEELNLKFGGDVGSIAGRLVLIEQRLTDRETNVARMRQEIEACFSADVAGKRATPLFEALEGMIAGNLGQFVSRQQIEAVLSEAGGVVLEANIPTVFVVSDAKAELRPSVVPLDATAFSGQGESRYPAAAQWEADLQAPIRRIASWAKSQSKSTIAIEGLYRLSTAFCLGHGLRSVNGLDLSLVDRSTTWLTADHPSAEPAEPSWTTELPSQLDGDVLHVAVGVLSDPSTEVRLHLGEGRALAVFRAHLPRAVTDGQDAQRLVRSLKRSLQVATDRLQPKQISLYYAGPRLFAVCLGHRWNTMPPTQLFERDREKGYLATAVLG